MAVALHAAAARALKLCCANHPARTDARSMHGQPADETFILNVLRSLCYNLVRTNRFAQARKVWGMLINRTRDFSRQVRFAPISFAAIS